MRKHRVFFAIVPPQELVPKIAKLVKQLKNKNTPVRWENPKKVHLTVAFMGILPQDKIEKAAMLATQVAEKTQEFPLALGGVNYLYKKHADSIIYIDVSDEKREYREFYKSFTKQLADQGFYPPTRPTLHLTIGRLKKIRKPAEKKEILSRIAQEEKGIYQDFLVGKFHLLESIYSPEVNTTKYHLMRTFPFSEKEKG